MGREEARPRDAGAAASAPSWAQGPRPGWRATSEFWALPRAGVTELGPGSEGPFRKAYLGAPL